MVIIYTSCIYYLFAYKSSATVYIYKILCTIWMINMYATSKSVSIPLKRKNNFDEVFITGCTRGCHFHNFRCKQWLKFHQNDITLFFILTLRMPVVGVHSSHSAVRSRCQQRMRAHQQSTYIRWHRFLAGRSTVLGCRPWIRCLRGNNCRLVLE